MDVRPIERPGSGTRLREEAIGSFDALVSHLIDYTVEAREQPFALFGHSLGALLAFETTRELRRRGAAGPKLLIVAAAPPPHVSAGHVRRNVHTLPDAEFTKYVQSLQGTPPEVFDDDELMAIVLSALRADFAAHSNYEWKPEPPISCPILALGGLDDTLVHRIALERWHELSSVRGGTEFFPGDHFFLMKQPRSVLEVLDREFARHPNLHD